MVWIWVDTNTCIPYLTSKPDRTAIVHWNYWDSFSLAEGASSQHLQHRLIKAISQCCVLSSGHHGWCRNHEGIHTPCTPCLQHPAADGSESYKPDHSTHSRHDTSASAPCKTYSRAHLAEAGEHLARHGAQAVSSAQKNAEITQHFSCIATAVALLSITE